MTGRAEVQRMRDRIDRAFSLIDQIPLDQYELRSLLAKLLCIFVSGFLERAVRELAMERCRKSSDRTVQSFVSSQLAKFTNPNTERILQLVGSFDLKSRESAELFIVDEKKEAINSINGLRNAIAHGDDLETLTYVRIKGYYDSLDPVIRFLADIFDPLPAT